MMAIIGLMALVASFCAPNCLAQNLSPEKQRQSAETILHNENTVNQLKQLLGIKFNDFYNNFEVMAEPKTTQDHSLLLEGWLQHLRLQNASILVISPTGKLYVAWITPDHNAIQYHTDDLRTLAIQPDIAQWGKRFKQRSFSQGSQLVKHELAQEHAYYFQTATFSIKIALYCATSQSQCDQAVYQGIRRSDGATLRLKGKVIRQPCSEATCPINSFEFTQQGTQYIVDRVSSSLVVIANGRMIVNQQGTWHE